MDDRAFDVDLCFRNPEPAWLLIQELKDSAEPEGAWVEPQHTLLRKPFLQAYVEASTSCVELTCFPTISSRRRVCTVSLPRSHLHSSVFLDTGGTTFLDVVHTRSPYDVHIEPTSLALKDS